MAMLPPDGVFIYRVTLRLLIALHNMLDPAAWS